MTWLQLERLRIGFGGELEGAQTLMITMRILLASAGMALIGRVAWGVSDAIVGSSTPGQIISVGLGVAAAIVFYAKAVLTMRIPEARQIEALVRGRLRSR
jgi:hypothetical protein